MPKKTDWRKTKKYAALKNSMLENLETRGLLEKAYTDNRGRIAENRSVSLEVQVARQMLAVWTALGFKDAAAKSSDVPGGVDDEL